jgi:hypothetical protein
MVFKNIVLVGALIYFSLLQAPTIASEWPDDIARYERYVIEHPNGTNKKQATPLYVSILTVDEEREIEPIIGILENINKISGQTLFVINEIMDKSNRDPNKEVKQNTDMVIIKGTRFMKVNITWFVFSIRGFVERYGKETINEIYHELSSEQYICRQYEWRKGKRGDDKFLTIIDDALGFRSFVDCSVVFFLRAIGIFPDPENMKVVSEVKNGNGESTFVINEDLRGALKFLYDSRVKKGQQFHEMIEALRL